MIKNLFYNILYAFNKLQMNKKCKTVFLFFLTLILQHNKAAYKLGHKTLAKKIVSKNLNRFGIIY